ncbi:MAG TPA: cytochrome c biogenesis protein CcdA [Clostridia bacterium]|nr:cytochrome c biogenesis protein CcdA [Clostridia bacterium]
MAPYILTFTEGILTFISPCILPMLPIYFLYLAGSAISPASVGQSGSAGTPGLPGSSYTGKNRILTNALGFVAGFTIVFLVLGAAATALGHFLDSNRMLVQRLSGLVMIIFGLNFAGIFKIGFLNMEKRFSYKAENLKFLSSMVFGMVFSFGWTPCLGAFLGSALLLAGNSGTMLEGISLLLVYSLGLGIPFIISSMILEQLKGAFGWLQKHGRIITAVSGILLIAAGLLVFFGIFKYLN